MWEENFGTSAGVLLIDGVRLIWGPLNTGPYLGSSRKEGGMRDELKNVCKRGLTDGGKIN